MAAEFKYGDRISEGVALFKANLVTCIVAMIALCVPFLGFVVIINLLKGFKQAKETGASIEIGALFNFDHAVDQIIGMFVFGILMNVAAMLFFIPALIVGGVFVFFPCMLADKPEAGWVNAFKGAMAYGKANLVPCIILNLVMGLVMSIGMVACGVGALVTFPIGLAAMTCTYLAHKDEVLAAAAADGVQL